MAISNRLTIGEAAVARIAESTELTEVELSGSSSGIIFLNYTGISLSGNTIVGSGGVSDNVSWQSPKGRRIGSGLNGRYYKISDNKFLKIDHIESGDLTLSKFDATSPDGNFTLHSGDIVHISESPDGASPTSYTIDTSNYNQAYSNMVGKYVSRSGETSAYLKVTDLSSTNAVYTIVLVGYEENYVPNKNYDYCFTNADIESISGQYAIGAVGDELTTDTLTVTVRSQTEITSKYGDVVRYYQDETLISKMYIDSVNRISADRYSLNCMSIVGLLDRINNAGNVYSNTWFSSVLTSVLSGIVTYRTDYTIDADVANIKVFGWLPYDTARNNLHRLLMAYNVSMFNESDKIRFGFLGQDGIGDISGSNTYISGSSTRERKPTRIIVREHSFVGGNTEKVKLFDNSSSGVGVTNQLVVFDTAPIERLETTEGLTIVSNGKNAAKVSGIGVLYGYPYFHNTYDMTVNTGSNETDNVVSITDDALITTQNSQAVMARLKSYYMQATTEKLSVARNGEKCGRRYNITSTVGQRVNAALLAKMSMNVSTFAKADCELISNIDYANSGKIMAYSTILTSTSSTTWTVPSWWAANTPIRVVLIGGGTGGSGGYAGANGEDGNSIYGGNGGEGGAGGKGGTSGKIYNVNLEVNPSDNFSYRCASGGSGGASSSSHSSNYPGSTGGDTTFGSYTSASGGRVDGGYVDFPTGTVYATVGNNGTAGGNGGKGGDLFLLLNTNVYTISNGGNGETCGSYLGGNGAEYDDATYTITRLGTTTTSYLFNYSASTGGGYTSAYGNCGGGGGSGATATSNGNNGTVASGTESDTSSSQEVSIWQGTLRAGKGANGVKPSARSATSRYGSGGDGGHGGSGAGGNGAATGFKNSYYISNPWYTGNYGNNLSVDSGAHTVATGGAGGNGGKGGNGCIIIYSPYSFSSNNYSAVADIAVAGKAKVGIR